MSIWEGIVTIVVTAMICKTLVYLYAIRNKVSIREDDPREDSKS